MKRTGRSEGNIPFQKLWRLATHLEAVIQRRSVKKLFLEISQNSQENTCGRACFLIITKETPVQVFSCEFCEVSKNTFFHRTPLAASSTRFPNSLPIFSREVVEKVLLKTIYINIAF